MGRTDNPTIWEKIQRNVQETERLIGQKKYNLAMIKARQTMEYMVKLHCDKAGIVESTPDTMIRNYTVENGFPNPQQNIIFRFCPLANRPPRKETMEPSMPIRHITSCPRKSMSFPIRISLNGPEKAPGRPEMQERQPQADPAVLQGQMPPDPVRRAGAGAGRNEAV